jgi:quercetin dioxygenase-like cupin family protein
MRPVALLVPLLLSAPAAAQVAAPVPVAEEPMHRVVFANERVRVIDAALPAGATSLYHVHDRDNLPIAVAGGRISVQPLGAAVAESDVALGAVSFAAGGYTHRVGNVGPGEVRFIDVELLGAPSAMPTRRAAVPPLHELVLENGRVRVYRVVLAPGQRLATHAHPGPAVHVTVRGGTPGSHRWMRAGEYMGIANDGAAAFEMVEVELVE